MRAIIPFRDEPGECLSVGPSQGLVYAIDSEIVVKVPFQYPVVEDPNTSHFLDLSLKSFVCLEKEFAVYSTLKTHPHPNIARRLETGQGQADWLFLERLVSLESAWPHSNTLDRRRWALEFLDGVRWLEIHGWANGDLAVRNLGIDCSNHLKIFDFGSAINSSHPDYTNDLNRDHFGLATCLHYILSGIDPFTAARSFAEVKEVQAKLSTGLGEIEQGAEVLAGIIQEGWTGPLPSAGFSQIFRRAFDILGPIDSANPTEYSERQYQHLERRCRKWLDNAPCDGRWKDLEQYVLECKAVGLEADLDVWR